MKASFKRLQVCRSGVIHNCVFRIAVLKALWITVIIWVYFLSLCFFLVHKPVLIQKFLAIAHFDSRVPSKAPVPARCQFLVGIVRTLNVALCNIGSSWDGCISVAMNGDCWGEARRFLRLVCLWGSWVKWGVRRGRHDWKINNFFISWQ